MKESLILMMSINCFGWFD